MTAAELAVRSMVEAKGNAAKAEALHTAATKGATPIGQSNGYLTYVWGLPRKSRMRVRLNTAQARTLHFVSVRLPLATRDGRKTTARRTKSHRSTTRSTAGASAGSDSPGEPPESGSLSHEVEPPRLIGATEVSR